MERNFIALAKEVKADKKRFCVFSSQINGRWYTVKFRQTCADVPKAAGVYLMFVDDAKLSLQRFAEANYSPVLWVSEISRCEELDREEYYAERNMRDMEDVFGESV